MYHASWTAALAVSLTQAVESIDGEGVARVACTVVRAIGVDANLFTDVKIFTAFIRFYRVWSIHHQLGGRLYIVVNTLTHHYKSFHYHRAYTPLDSDKCRILEC